MDTKRAEVEVLAGPRAGRKRRFSAAEKQAFLEEAAQPGNSISEVARRYGVAPSLMFRWRRLHEEGALEGLAADESVVGESELKELRAEVRELQRLLGKKTVENEILHEALRLARSKKLLSVRTLLPKGGGR